MEHIFNYLVVWLAPILCFTAEEAWLARHGDADDSVHLHVFPEVPKDWENKTLSDKWNKIRTLRRAVTGHIEGARMMKIVGSSLEAKPAIYLSHQQRELLKDLDFAEICITSDLFIGSYEDADKSSKTHIWPEAPEAMLIDTPMAEAPGLKCERCWRVLEEVGTHADHPDLCNRCRDAVRYLRKEAA
jgi:isoleucyl-tRNA synthetase